MTIVKSENKSYEFGDNLAMAYRAALSLARDTGLTHLVEFKGQKIANIASSGNELFFDDKFAWLFGEVR